MSAEHCGAALAVALFCGIALHALITSHDTYDGRIVPYFRSRQLYYERFYKRHEYYSGEGFVSTLASDGTASAPRVWSCGLCNTHSGEASVSQTL